AAPCGRPVVLADVQDNPGAGASSDSTGLLAALIEEEAQGALLGLLADPEIAAEAHRLGECACFTGDLGGKSGLQGQVPLRARFRVETLSDRAARYTGEMYGGGIAILGPSAVLRAEGAADIRVVVTTFRSQCLDLGLFTHFGLEPAQHRILAVKSTLHYRAAFDPIAARTLSVAAPGGFPCHLPNIRYRNLRPGMRRLS
ncbi:MAG: MlrC C-terminal domain-containing protein, partial [Pseudomonadota bacterium]